MPQQPVEIPPELLELPELLEECEELEELWEELPLEEEGQINLCKLKVILTLLQLVGGQHLQHPEPREYGGLQLTVLELEEDMQYLFEQR